MEITSAQICEDLLELIKHTKGHLFELAEKSHLTPIQLFALYAIKHGESTMGQVAYALHCDASNVTGIVDRLVANGLVMRHESQQDRRTKTLELTDKGRRTVNAIINKMPGYLCCDKLSRDERTALHRAISKLVA